MTIKSSCDKNGVTDKQNIQGKDDFFYINTGYVMLNVKWIADILISFVAQVSNVVHGSRFCYLCGIVCI